ncbi:hypothetical protein [Streptomyces sp. NPDC048644]|uniref:nSTAND1 domain-containing NTPase n=1 Tax=Streptomyces sp. NPDC048644 TaxID=3365582 RepID=UPI00371B7114
MGRPENPIDPQSGPVQRFAHELRKLRDEAGTPAYRAMARRAGYSAGTLSQAAAGERLPTLPVLLAYVSACQGDTGYWRQRWEEADEELARLPAPHDEDADPPYRGLARFEPGDAELFFGRDELTSQLTRMARGHRVSALVGASGSGKSSLLRAGLVPRVRRPQDSGEVPPAAVRILTPGPHPLAHGRRLEPATGPGETWLLVDQFEELFTLCADPGERDAFLERLLAARDADSRLRVVLAVRADFFGRCAQHGGLAAALKDATLLVGPMDRAQYREAVVRPATACGLTVERDLTARIVEDVEHEPGALPLLSHALRETWHRRRGRTLTLQAYEAAGGLHGAIARTADDAYHRLGPAQADLARHVLLRLVAPGNGTQDTHRPAPRAEFDRLQGGADSAAVLDRLARARLLTLDDGHVRLAHEAVITAWPRLHGWIGEERERMRLHRQLTRDAAAWQELDRDPGALYRGTRLARAQESFTADERGTLNPLEAAFLDAGLDAHAAERAHAARAARRTRGAFAALATLCALLLVAGTLAWQQKRDTDRQHAQSEARRIASVAAGLRATDPVRATRLSVAAWRLARTPETRGAVLGALARREVDAMPLPDGTNPSDEASDPVLTDDGRTLLYPDRDRIRRWDVRTHRELPSHRATAADISLHLLQAATRDGGAVAMEHNPGGLRVFRTTGTRTERHVLTADGLPVFGDSGRTLLSLSPGSFELWDWRHGRPLFRQHLPRHTGPDGTEYYEGAVSPDDRYVAVCTPHSAPEVWDVARHRRKRLPWSPKPCGSGVPRFTHDGRALLNLADGAGAEARDLTSGRRLWRVGHSGLTDMQLSPDGSLLAGRDTDEILVWRTSRPGAPVLRYPIPNEEVTHLRMDTGRQVLRYVGGGAVRTLSLTPPAARPPGEPPVAEAEFSAGADRLATARERDGGAEFRLLDARTGKTTTLPSREPCTPPVSPPHDRCEIFPFLSFGPQGRRLAYGAETASQAGGRRHLPVNGRVHVWDADTRRPVATPPALKGRGGTRVSQALFTAHGRSLLLSDGAEAVKVWDAGKAAVRSLGTVSGQLLAAHPDGRRFVIGVGANTSGRLVGLASRRVSRQSLTGGTTTVIAFSPDGRLLAAGDSAGRVTLWDGLAERRLGELPATEGGSGAGGQEAVTALAFAPDGDTLATAGDHGTLRLWDTGSNQPLGDALPTLPGDPLLAVAFTPDGKSLRTAGRHTPLQTYTAAPDRAARTLCRRAHGGLSPAEWRSYLPAVPYRPTC